jgi:hypothetical protein
VTIQDLGSLGELIAAIATVATLIYLAVQIRQNTSTVRSSSAAADTQNQNALLLLLSQDAELNRIFWSGLDSRSQLDLADQRRFDPLMSALLNNYEQSWRFYRERAIGEETWSSQFESIKWFAAQPGFTEYWAIWGITRSRDFATVLDGARAQEISISPPPAA